MRLFPEHTMCQCLSLSVRNSNNLCVCCGCHTAVPREPSGLLSRALQKLLVIIIFTCWLQFCSTKLEYL